MSWRPEVKVEGKWTGNAMTFETEREAKDYAKDLMHRWIKVNDYRAVKSTEKASYKWGDHKLEKLI